MRDYHEKLIQRLKLFVDNKKSPVVFLEAGHYDPRFGPTTFSYESLKESIAVGEDIIKNFGKKVKVVFGILIDDLGLNCGKEGCSITSQPLVEECDIREIENIFASSRFIKRERVLNFSERTAKNRAIASLRKLLKAKSPKVSTRTGSMTESLSFELLSGESVLLAERQDSIYRAKCPSIMGQHYLDCLSKIRQRFTNMSNLIIVDWSQMLDFSKVTAGAEATYSVFLEPERHSEIEILNVFYLDECGDEFTYEHTVSESFSVKFDQESY